MKTLLIIVALSCAPAWGTLTKIQEQHGTCTAGSCPITVTSTGSGHFGIIAFSTGGNQNVTITGVSGGGTWIHPASCNGTLASPVEATDVDYILALTSGVTSITVTASASVGGRVSFSEWSFTGSSVAFDTCGTANPVGVNVASPTLTISGSNDVIVTTIILSTGNPTACTYTGFTDFPGASTGFCGQLNVATGAPNTWTNVSASTTETSIAIKEITGGGGVVRRRAQVINK